MPSIHEAIELLKRASIATPSDRRAPTPEEIGKTESELGSPLSPAFKIFLAEAGQYRLPFWETFWVGDDSLGYRNLVEANRAEHQDVEPALPPFLITFHNNGMGDQICFDIRFPNRAGEYPIVFWDHEQSSDQEIDPIAACFADWLYDEAQQALMDRDE